MRSTTASPELRHARESLRRQVDVAVASGHLTRRKGDDLLARAGRLLDGKRPAPTTTFDPHRRPRRPDPARDIAEARHLVEVELATAARSATAPTATPAPAPLQAPAPVISTVKIDGKPLADEIAAATSSALARWQPPLPQHPEVKREAQTFGMGGPNRVRLLTADGATAIDPPTRQQIDELILTNGGVPPATETRLDYDVRLDGNPVYVGTAESGTATSASDWTVKKLDYDVTNRLTRQQTVENAKWDDRATLGWT